MSHHRAVDELGHARRRRRLERRRVVFRDRHDRFEQLRRHLQVADEHQLIDAVDGGVEHAGPRVRACFDLQQIQQQPRVQGADRFVADRRQPGADAHRRIVADLVDFHRLRLRRRQFARVALGHELRVGVRHQHFARAGPHALELRIVLEHRRGLRAGGRQDFLLLGRIRHERLERRGEPAAGAAILDDVVDQELGEHLVGETRLQLAGEVHARRAGARRQRRRIGDERQQHVRRHLRRGARHLRQHRVELFGLAVGGVIRETMHQFEQRLALLDRIVAARLADLLQALRELDQALRLFGERHHVLHGAAAITLPCGVLGRLLLEGSQDPIPGGALAAAGALAQDVGVVDLGHCDRLVAGLLPRFLDAAERACFFRRLGDERQERVPAVVVEAIEQRQLADQLLVEQRRQLAR